MRAPAIALLALVAAASPAFAQASGEEGMSERDKARAALPPEAAKRLFGDVRAPAALEARSISFLCPRLPRRRGGPAGRRGGVAGDAPVAQSQL